MWRGVQIPLPYLYLWTVFFPLEGFFNLLIFMHPKVLAVKKCSGTNNISWPRAFVKTFWLGLTSRDSSQNNKARAAASDNKKKKNDHAALAGSGQNNNTSATALSSSNSVLNTTGDISQLSTPHQMSTGGISAAPNTEAQAPLGSEMAVTKMVP